VLFLKVSDLNLPQNQRQIVSAATAFFVDKESIGAMTSVPKGAVVLPKRGAAISTNKKRLTSCHCLLDPNLLAVVPGANLTSDYLFAWLERFDLRSITDSNTLPQINKKDLEPVLLQLPSLSEQRAMASHLSAIEAKLSAEVKRRMALDNLFQSLLHNLMTGRVRVNHLFDELVEADPGVGPVGGAHGGAPQRGGNHGTGTR
jgi:type I restriction enzyme, S subunit